MTLTIACATGDGLVLAADSRTTISIGGQQRALSDFTHKVFQVGQVGISTYGWAFLDRRNIAGHMSEFARQLDELAGPIEVAARLNNFFGDLIDRHIAAGYDAAPPAGVDELGFLVIGYEDGIGAIIEVLLPSRQVSVALNTAAIPGPGAAWRGQTDVVQRVIKGASLDTLQIFATQDGAIMNYLALAPSLQKLQYQLHFNYMNLQDAIDFATFLIRTTIDAQRFAYGLAGNAGLSAWPGVGGPIEVLAITPDRWEWVQRTELQGERPAGVAEAL